MELQYQTPRHVQKPSLWVLLVAAVLGLLLAGWGVSKLAGKEPERPEVITVSSLQKIIHVSELSTFTAVYNGIAEVKNETKPEETDYYVSYEAKVEAGLDLEQIDLSVNQEAKVITVQLPDIYLTDINVDITSLDYIFLNPKANTSTVTQAAFQACEADVQQECQEQTAIYDLAKQNAVNVLTALIHPLLEQLDTEYQLVID